MNILTQNAFYTQMKEFMIANQSKITDLNYGSALDTQFQAMATQLNQALVKSAGNFKTQFESIPYQAFDFNRKAEEKASGTVVFSRQVASATQIAIPIGTVVGTSSGLLYTTQDVVYILSGNNDSGAANIIAEKSGITYNVLTGVINVLNSSVPGVNSVVNNIAASGGLNKESNASYFTRFKNFVLGLSGSNKYGIFTAATSVSTIQSGYVEDHFPPEAGLYNFTIYVDDGSGSVPQLKLDEIKLVIFGNNTVTYQGWVAAGINFRVLSAGLVPVDIVYSAEIDTLNTNASIIELLIENALKNYINSLWVGSDVIWSEIIKIIQGLNGVISVSSLTLNGSPVDIVTLPSQVIRVSTITGTIS